MKEAKKRGLSNNKNTPDALKVKINKENIALFEKHSVLSKVETEARYEIELEEYTMRMQIEGRVLSDMASTFIIPTAVAYQNTLIENVAGLKEIFGSSFKKMAAEQIELIKEISEHIAAIKSQKDAMTIQGIKANKMTDSFKQASAYCKNVKPFFEEIRSHCDALEMMVSDELWPLPKYRELLFTK